MRRRLWVAIWIVMTAVRCSTHCADRPPAVAGEPQREFAVETIRGATRDFEVYVRGEGPPIVVLHELPGASPATFRLARLISDAGFRVYVPILFGRAGEYRPNLRFFTVCLSRDFDCRSRQGSGRIVGELMPLVARVDQGKGVGVIGMCLTGTVPLQLSARGANVVAAVVSQPALPVLSDAAGMTDDDLRKVNVPVVLTRFSCDKRSPRPRFDHLRELVKGPVTAIEIDSGPSNPWMLPANAHSVLTGYFANDAKHPTRQVLDRAIAMFRQSFAVR